MPATPATAVQPEGKLEFHDSKFMFVPYDVPLAVTKLGPFPEPCGYQLNSGHVCPPTHDHLSLPSWTPVWPESATQVKTQRFGRRSELRKQSVVVLIGLRNIRRSIKSVERSVDEQSASTNVRSAGSNAADSYNARRE